MGLPVGPYQPLAACHHMGDKRFCPRRHLDDTRQECHVDLLSGPDQDLHNVLPIPSTIGAPGVVHHIPGDAQLRETNQIGTRGRGLKCEGLDPLHVFLDLAGLGVHANSGNPQVVHLSPFGSPTGVMWHRHP